MFFRNLSTDARPSLSQLSRHMSSQDLSAECGPGTAQARKCYFQTKPFIRKNTNQRWTTECRNLNLNTPRAKHEISTTTTWSENNTSRRSSRIPSILAGRLPERGVVATPGFEHLEKLFLLEFYHRTSILRAPRWVNSTPTRTKSCAWHENFNALGTRTTFVVVVWSVLRAFVTRGSVEQI